MNSLGTWLFVLFAVGQLDCIHTRNANAVLKYVNIKRKLHGCPPLFLNENLSINCTIHAKDIAKSGVATASKPTDHEYTENICTFALKPDSLRLCVEEWYNRIRYDNLDAEAQEFTAMIWRESQYMGYGEAMVNSRIAVMVVRFVPAGNVIGQYTYNVPHIDEYETDWKSNCATHQTYRAPLIMLAILTIGYWSGII